MKEQHLKENVVNQVEHFIESNSGFVEQLFKTVKKTGTKTLVAFIDMSALELHVVDNFEHIEWLEKRYDWVAQELLGLEERLDDFYGDFVFNLEPDEHPAMHNYEFWAADERSETHAEIIADVAAKHHVFRIGFFQRNMEVGPVREKDLDEKSKKFFNALAQELGFKLKISKHK